MTLKRVYPQHAVEYPRVHYLASGPDVDGSDMCGIAIIGADHQSNPFFPRDQSNDGTALVHTYICARLYLAIK